MPADLLSREELSPDGLATRLGVSTDEVIRREQAGELFSYFKPRRSNDRLYPVYQLAPEIYPELLHIAMKALTNDGPLLDIFFTWRDRDLADLTVREVLAGRTSETFQPEDEAAWLLSLPMSRRMEAVMGALQRLRADTQDCG